MQLTDENAITSNQLKMQLITRNDTFKAINHPTKAIYPKNVKECKTIQQMPIS